MTNKSGFYASSTLAVISVVAALGAFSLRDYLSFDALRDNREALDSISRQQLCADGAGICRSLCADRRVFTAGVRSPR